MSDLIFFAMFWVPLGVGLALQLALFVRMPKRKNRVLLSIALLSIFSGVMYVFLMQHELASTTSLTIALGTVGPTFLVSLLAYEITALLVEKTWIKVTVAAVLGAPMVIYSIVFYFGLGCLTTGDCL